MDADAIVIEGARENNLQGVDLRIPHRTLTVFCGVSGSGKSSLALDTVFAEGRRRYVESLSAYARQFLGQLERPRYTRLKGLSPTIAVDAGGRGSSPRSTVGTATEIHDYLRVLYARLGVQHCHRCGRAVGRHDPDRIQRELAALPEGTRFQLLAPLVQDEPGDHAELLAEALRDGYGRVRVDGEVRPLEPKMRLSPDRPHTIEIIVDRLVARPGAEARIADSVETAMKAGSGTMILAPVEGDEQRFSEHLACPDCGVTFPELQPSSFSFNSPRGCCPECRGLGTVLQVDPERVVPDPGKSLRQGAVVVPGFRSLGKKGWTHAVLLSLTEDHPIDLDTPWRDLPEQARRVILHGPAEDPQRVGPDGQQLRPSEVWAGIVPTVLRRMKETSSEGAQEAYRSLLVDAACPACEGHRLRAESVAVRVGDRSLPELEALPIAELLRFLAELPLDETDAEIAQELLGELRARLGLVDDLGLGYLSLDRRGPTLSGGETQRLRLAGQLGGELSGVTYVLDEPSTGLHPVDNDRLVQALHRLRDEGNTVLVVEHDEAVLRAADHLVDFGPGAGELGGRVVAEGSFEELCAHPDSLTGAYLTGRRTVAPPRRRRTPGDRKLVLRGAAGNNLQHIDLELPLGCLVAISGVSGAGKSTLVNDILHPALARKLHRAKAEPLAYDRVEGLEHLTKVVRIDQQPIGRSPRSTAATYTGAFDQIRELFASTREARAYGFKPGRFSFNSKGGRCEACKGDGLRKVEMHFLPDVRVRCELCGGTRFNEATLRVRYHGLSIAQVLELSCEEAARLFAAVPKLARILDTLRDVGLGYLRLGQPANTLSGGEAQRVKLARELSRAEQGSSLYLLDEPSRGLHPEDVARLVAVLQRLVDRGNAVVVVEHDLDILAQADLLVDLGPGAGAEGGRIVAQGTPEEVAAMPESVTGRYLAKRLAR